jgi:hypothetical protein
MQANKSYNFFHQKMAQSLFSENKSYMSKRRQLLTSWAVFLDYHCFSVRNFKVSKVKACKQSKSEKPPPSFKSPKLSLLVNSVRNIFVNCTSNLLACPISRAIRSNYCSYFESSGISRN